MIEKILGVGVAALLVLCSVLGFQLSLAHSANATLTSERDAAKDDAANARAAQQTAEAQNHALALAFTTLDQHLTQLGANQDLNARKLAEQLSGLTNLQKSEGDANGSFECLDLPVPHSLDQWLLDSPAADGGH